MALLVYDGMGVEVQLKIFDETRVERTPSAVAMVSDSASRSMPVKLSSGALKNDEEESQAQIAQLALSRPIECWRAMEFNKEDEIDALNQRLTNHWTRMDGSPQKILASIAPIFNRSFTRKIVRLADRISKLCRSRAGTP